MSASESCTTRQRHVQKQDQPQVEKPKSEKPNTKPVPRLFSAPFWVAVTLLGVLVFMSVNSTMNSSSSTGFQTGLFSAEELSKYDANNSDTILLSCLGQVFEVTKGRRFYGTGQSYSFFSGRDASRAFVSGKFSQEGNQAPVDDVADLDNDEIFAIVEWRDFYHKEYKYLGKLAGGRYYDHAGSPTQALKLVEEKNTLAMKEQKKVKDAEKLHPNCNSRWSQADGGMVWCNEGHPRKTFVRQKGSETVFRCACFESESFSERHQLYQDCSPSASKCQTSPPRI